VQSGERVTATRQLDGRASQMLNWSLRIVIVVNLCDYERVLSD
jgi:hypothetical protein